MCFGKYKVSLLSLSLASLLMGCLPSQSLELSGPSPTATTGTAVSTSENTLTTSPPPGVGQFLPITAQAQLSDQTFHLEVAATPEQQELGLMYRPALPDHQGMLFPYNPARFVGFWMRNVPVALDMVFLYQGSVVAIAASVPPCPASSQTCPVYSPRGLVDQVLELRAGRAQELNLQVGDRVPITFNPS